MGSKMVQEDGIAEVSDVRLETKMAAGIVRMQKGDPMKDPIEGQAAIDAILAVTGNSSVRELYEHVQEHGLAEMWSGGVNAAIDIIIAVPSAQPDIIRCKDCKWYGRADKRRFYRGMDCLQHRIDTIVPDKDFCSRAERRQDAIN